MSFSPTRLFWIVLLGTVLSLVAANWPFFFATPWIEQGDTAVNALQIERAKDLREIWGNYSRFHFHHPGPAFFYLYAAGEVVLCDWLRVCPSPANAHIFAGLVTQAFFLALALALAARWIKRPLFVPLALLAAAVHFKIPGYAFLSIWPPHVLLMPFLAFWVACVSVAAGRGQDICWAVLAGSFLVHGHVAQPLFVAGLFLPAYWLLWRHQRAGGAPAPWRAFPAAHAAGLLLLLLFLTPILLDLRLGERSNLQDILRHLQFSGDERKSPLAGLVYLLSFFGYETRQGELLTTLSPGSLVFFRDRWPAYLFWLVLLAAGAAGLRRRVFALDAGEAGFGRRAGQFWLLGAGLCVVWGVMQAGEMMDFNGYFYYGFIYLLLAAAAALVSTLTLSPAAGSWISAAALVGGAAVALTTYRLPSPGTNLEELAARDAILRAIAADPQRQRPKMLSFYHRDWPDVALAALVLERAKVPFYTDENWEFMFLREHLIPNDWLRLPEPPISVWRFIPRTKGAPGLRFTKDLNIMLEPGRLSPADGEIDFSRNGNLQLYLTAGLAAPESDTAWTSQNDVLLQFRPVPTDRDVEIRIEAAPFLAKKVAIQPTELRFNGQLLFSSPFTEIGVLRVRIPKELWNKYPVASIHLFFPNAKAPWQVGVSGDVRILALAIRRLTTRLATTPAP